MQEFPDLTLEEIAVFEASTPGRAARQFLAQRDPTAYAAVAEGAMSRQ